MLVRSHGSLQIKQRHSISEIAFKEPKGRSIGAGGSIYIYIYVCMIMPREMPLCQKELYAAYKMLHHSDNSEKQILCAILLCVYMSRRSMLHFLRATDYVGSARTFYLKTGGRKKIAKKLRRYPQQHHTPPESSRNPPRRDPPHHRFCSGCRLVTYKTKLRVTAQSRLDQCPT